MWSDSLSLRGHDEISFWTPLSFVGVFFPCILEFCYLGRRLVVMGIVAAKLAMDLLYYCCYCGCCCFAGSKLFAFKLVA